MTLQEGSLRLRWRMNRRWESERENGKNRYRRLRVASRLYLDIAEMTGCIHARGVGEGTRR